MSGLSVLVHGFAKVGKSTLGATTPAPRLVLDAESGSEFVPGFKIYWEPMRGHGWMGQDPATGIWTWGGTPPPPPSAELPWDTCLVRVRAFSDVDMAYQWLNNGQHPFNSVVLDSVSEIQQRCVDQLVGADQMKTQDWGSLLRIVSQTIRQFRDLKMHPTHPLQSIVYICETAEQGNVHSKWRPAVQGALRDKLPYIPDICGYLSILLDGAGQPVRYLLISQHPDFEAGERVGGVLGPGIYNPNVTEMLRIVTAAQTGRQ